MYGNMVSRLRILLESGQLFSKMNSGTKLERKTSQAQAPEAIDMLNMLTMC
jgi:hypothetical protein